MQGTENITQGMEVYAKDDRLVGTVERVERNAIYVGGRQIADAAVARVKGNRVYLQGVYNEMGATGQTTLNDKDTVRVPVYEERLNVDKRQGELGEVAIHKTVTEEQVSVPVELRREQVRVDQVDIDDRPAGRAVADAAFKEETIRVPVRGEEAIVEKQAYVTGEVVINKEQTVARQHVADTVRREHVEVDENYDRLRSGFQQHFTDTQRTMGATGTRRTFEEAEPTYKLGYAAGRDPRYSKRSFDQAETDLRRDYEQRIGAVDDNRWEQLKREAREAYDRARGI